MAVTQSFLKLEDIVFPAAVSLLGAFQLATMARKVGMLRKKFKITCPQMTGDPAFERSVRAQQNSVEFFPIFMTCLWMSGIFFHQVPSSLAGLLYIYSRSMYFEGYCKAVEGRIPGFKLGMKALMALLATAIAGLLTNLTRTYTGFDLADFVFRRFL